MCLYLLPVLLLIMMAILRAGVSTPPLPAPYLCQDPSLAATIDNISHLQISFNPLYAVLLARIWGKAS